MYYEEPMTIEEKYDKLVHMIDALYRESRGRMEHTHEMYMLERDESKAEMLARRNNANHDVHKVLMKLDRYVDLLEQVPTKE